MKKYIIVFFLVISCKSYIIKPTDYPLKNFNEGLKYLEKWILNQMEQYKIVGLSLVLVDNKKILWQFQGGYENKEKRIYVNNKTNFQIGSIAKIINTIAILKLVQEHKLNLEDPIHKYLQDLPKNYDYHKPITIKHLIIHHSGLPSDLIKFLWNDKYIPLSEITKEIHQIYLSYEPGEIFSYSNLGVTLSGRIIEIITKKSYNDYIKNILDKLEMYSTTTNLYEVKNLSKGYGIGTFGNVLLEEPPIVMIPAGGFYSNAEDMAKLMQMILNQGEVNGEFFLSKELIQQMFSVQNVPIALDDEFKIGLPFFLNDLGFGKMIQASHGGDTIAFHSMMILLPELPLGIMVMTNTTTGVMLASKIALETLALFVKYKYSIEKTNQFDISLKNTLFNAEEILGYYNTSSGALRIYKNKKEQLICTFLEYDCEFIKEPFLYRFRIKILGFIPIEIFQNSKFLFKKIDNKNMLYIVNGNTTIPFGTKIPESLFLKNNSYYLKNKKLWKDRMGIYFYKLKDQKEPFFYIKNFLITQEENFFVVKIYYNQNPYPLIYFAVPIEKDLIQIYGYGRNLGDILIFKENQVYYSGFTLEKINSN